MSPEKLAVTVPPRVSISIVSHGQGEIIRDLLEDCRTFKSASFEILLTLNIPEDPIGARQS